MNIEEQSISVLTDAIIKAVDSKVESASFDRTVEGSILKVLPSNTYVVLITGKEYTITSKNSTIFKECQKVLMHLPQNDYKRLRFIDDVNSDAVIAQAVTSVNNKTGNVMLEIADIPNLSASLVTPICNRYTKTATDNEVVEITVPSIATTTHQINILWRRNNLWEKPIHGIDYGYRFKTSTTLQVDFYTGGVYLIDYVYANNVAINTITL